MLPLSPYFVQGAISVFFLPCKNLFFLLDCFNRLDLSDLELKLYPAYAGSAEV